MSVLEQTKQHRMTYKIFFSYLFLLFTTCITLHAQKISDYTPMYLSDIDATEYGQGTGIGFSILGDGLGFQVRKTLKTQDQIGLGTHLFVTAVSNPEQTEFDRLAPGIFLRGEYNFHLGNKLKEKAKRTYVKRKLRKHYLSAKAGAGFSTFNTYSAVLSWHRETFKVGNKKVARGLDLGIAYNIVPDSATSLIGSSVGIYLRFDWMWFRQKSGPKSL